ncbi:hypothetical protein SLE2022_223970 [Rubroshorea leprosula]
MDPREISDDSNKGFQHLFFRISFALLFPIFSFFLLSFLVGLAATFIGDLYPMSVPSQCKIVSSSVDLRSVKVCELGLLNYKAKHFFYPSERTKYRCHYEYYWTSVFKVEYKDHFLGQKRLAFTEAPNEALPLNCRPDFGAAYLTKDKFKVNETYDCWYTSGISKVKLYHDAFFSCQTITKDTSSIEMTKRLTTRILDSWFSSKGRASYWRWETVAGAVTGFSTSLITISFFRVLQQTKYWLPRVNLTRICFLLLYVSFMGWLACQYWKRLNLPAIKKFEISR